MLISSSHKFIFIAVPKTGTSSVEHALASYNNSELTEPFNKHVLAMKLVNHIPATIWATSFKFTFVRNPIDWLFSWYRYRQREELRNPAHRFHHRFTGNISFDTFIQTFSESEMFLKQSDFICTHQGKLLVDFVGTYENLQRDFSKICSQIEITEINLQKLRSSRGEPGQKLNISPSSRKIIFEYFRQDFDLFNYNNGV